MKEPVGGYDAGESGGNASLTLIGTHRSLRTVVVTEEFLEDIKEANRDNVRLFLLGEFLCAGSFWLGVEKLITEGYKDIIFIWCAATFFAGAVIIITGLRQHSRKQTRIQKYLDPAHSLALYQKKEGQRG